jgi:hypothetical protein
VRCPWNSAGQEPAVAITLTVARTIANVRLEVLHMQPVSSPEQASGVRVNEGGQVSTGNQGGKKSDGDEGGADSEDDTGEGSDGDSVTCLWQ